MLGIFLLQHHRHAVDLVDQPGMRQGDLDGGLDKIFLHEAHQFLLELFGADLAGGADEYRLGILALEGGQHGLFFQAIDLVEDHQHRLLGGANLLQHLVDHLDLLVKRRMADIDHVQQQIGFHRLVEGALE